MYDNLDPSAVWEFYLENKDLLSWETMQVARSISGLYKICMRCDDTTPCIEVYERGIENPVYKESFCSKEDAEAAIVKVYDVYSVEDEESYMKVDRYETIRDREAALLEAFKRFVEVSTNGDARFRDIFKSDSDARNSLDKIIEHLAYERGLAVYRPKFVNVNGEERYAECPYKWYDEDRTNVP